MFDRLIDIITDWFEQLLPFFVVRHYEEAVVLRFGKFHKTVKPGFHWRIPFVDAPIEQHVVTTTLSLSPQSLYTKDKQNIVVKGLIKYRIADIQIFILEVYDAQDAISDMTQYIIKNIIMDKTLDECIDTEIDNILTKKARVEAKKWGVEIQQVTLTDIAPIRSYRIINDTVINKLD
jgi:regulator of protease activity HflC (stomatin/prohibitin superfamily)